MNSIVTCLLLLVIFFASCNKDSSPDIIKTTGDVSSVIRKLEAFSTIELYSSIQLNLIKDTSDFIEIVGGENLLPKIETSIKSTTLKITNNNKFNFVRSYKLPIKATLHYKQLKHFKYYGAGDIHTLDTLKEKEFSFESWNGSGNLYFLLNTEISSFGFHTGLVDLTVVGNTIENRLYSTAEGIINCSKLITNRTYCHNKGIANYYVMASDVINAQIYGEGNVFYHGMPKSISSNETSIGKLISKNN